jgi:DNA polymerase-4
VTERVIVHADMDAFYAAVEQLDDPSLRGVPVLVGGTGNRGVVSTASYEARPFGVHSAMPMAEARRRCPQAVVLAPNFERYTELSRRIMDVFGSFSPLVEPLSLDEAFVDMTGAEGLFGSPEQIGRRVKRDVFAATEGLTVSVGIAASKYVAKVASDHDKPDGLVIVEPGTEREFLWPQPVSRLWGVGPRGQERLQELGLATIGDVARANVEFLERKLGSLGPHIHALAHARDVRQVIPDRDARSIGAERTLETDVIGEEQIRPHLRNVCEIVARRLRKHDLRAGGVRVKLKTADFKLRTRQAPARPPSDSFDGLLAAAFSLLDQFDLTQPMRLIGIAAFDLVDADGTPQQELFGDERVERARRLDRALDAVHERFGDEAIHRGDIPRDRRGDGEPD